MRITLGKETASVGFFVCRWVSAWLTIAEGVVATVTLGFVWPRWSLMPLEWQMNREIENERIL